MAKLPTSKKIFDLRGEGQANQDGTSRQEELLDCEPGEAVELVREPGNEYDFNAILVVSSRGVGIGYIAREDAALLAPALDDGRHHMAVLHRITGGVQYASAYGARISIAWDRKPGHPHVPLDEEQLKSRRGKKSVRGRQRDSSGRLIGTSEKSGCAGAIALLVISSIVHLMNI